jgi:sialate O-acetylesterase
MRFDAIFRRLGLAAAVLALLVVVQPRARGDVKVPAIFGSQMVLQRDQKDRVWGWAEAGEDITVKIAGQSHSTKAGADGSWQVMLDPMPAGGPHTLAIEGKNTLSFDQVLIGEVWICSGQSNMQWSVASAKDADLEIATAKYPSIRLITVPNFGTQEPQKDFRGRWQECRPDTVGRFSAVGYFFGRRLHQVLDVPVGLINDAWGGSACEAWIRRDILAADEKYGPLLKRWEKLENGLSEAKSAYESKLAEWTTAAAKAKADGKEPPRRPTNPGDQMRGNARPGNIYNGVLKPTIGYGIRGVIWYQGETNVGRAYQYRDLFPLLIKSWRDEWGQGDFSFYWVQLADFLPEVP